MPRTHRSLWGLLIPVRRAFHQYVNLRPAKLLRGLTSPLRAVPDGGIDILVVREKSEGEYSDIGGRFGRGTPAEFALQESVFSRAGIERVARYAVGLAASRSGRLASATKSNGIIHTMPFWDEVVREVAGERPEVQLSEYHVEALAALFVLDPGRFDVGSAPDIAGQGKANQLGQVWSGALMLEHLGHADAAEQVLRAVEHVLAETGVRTADLGGTAGTREVTEELLAAVRRR